MAQETINVGQSPNDGTGDTIRGAYEKCNNNFGELYSRSQLANKPDSSVGSDGDTRGMIAFPELDPQAQDDQLYVCLADYDGSSNIWARITLDTTVWPES